MITVLPVVSLSLIHYIFKNSTQNLILSAKTFETRKKNTSNIPSSLPRVKFVRLKKFSSVVKLSISGITRAKKSIPALDLLQSVKHCNFTVN